MGVKFTNNEAACSSGFDACKILYCKCSRKQRKFRALKLHKRKHNYQGNFSKACASPVFQDQQKFSFHVSVQRSAITDGHKINSSQLSP